jgi:hypothetical protein
MRCGSHNFGRFTFHESVNHPETAEENLIDSNTTYYTLIKMPYYIYTALLAYYTKAF